jgi:hypothetical protein
MPADEQERQAGDGSCRMPADVHRQDRRWIVQHARKYTEAGQEMDLAACWKMYKNRARDGLYSMPADAQNTEAGQEMYHTACRHMYRGRAGDGLYSMLADGQRQGKR